MRRACEAAQQMLGEYAAVELHCGRYGERNPHPGGQEAFRIRARLPWHRELDTPVKVEITIDEPILWPVAQREIMHEYGEPLKVEVPTYSLEEVVAEKLRAILQQLDQLERGGGCAPSPRLLRSLERAGQISGGAGPDRFRRSPA